MNQINTSSIFFLLCYTFHFKFSFLYNSTKFYFKQMSNIISYHLIFIFLSSVFFLLPHLSILKQVSSIIEKLKELIEYNTILFCPFDILQQIQKENQNNILKKQAIYLMWKAYSHRFRQSEDCSHSLNQQLINIQQQQTKEKIQHLLYSTIKIT